jgi:RNA polymerase sigma-70 factor (ECF subfamily)
MSYSSWSTEELVRACAEKANNEAWAEFIYRFRKLIAYVILRIARRYGETSGAHVDDLIQDTYLKVCSDNCRLLREFEPRHPDAFLGMLKVTAVNVAHDYFRARRSAKRGSGISECELSDVDMFVPDSHSLEPANIEREILLREIDAILRGASSPANARDREIFWLHYRQGFTAKAIAAISTYKLTTKGVESILYRLTGYVRTRLGKKGSDAGKLGVQSEDIRLSNTLDKEKGSQ